MKRYFLYGLIVLAVIATVAFGFRKELFIYAVTPGVAYAGYSPPSTPDYANEAAWAALPNRRDSVDALPLGADAADLQDSAAADVFFVHPTTYYRRDGWNADIKDMRTNNFTESGSLRHQASVFNGCCRIYAPRYRQATLAAFIDTEGNGAPALELAYGDVKAAFEYYLQTYNRGRPFILAGHSQGARHAIRLMAEQIDGKPIAARMIAAYLIGYPLKLTQAGRPFEHASLCQNAQDTGCILGWNTTIEGGDPLKFRAANDLSSGLPEVQRTAMGASVCTNPLNWHVDGEADASAHLGAMPFDRSEAGAPLPVPQKNLIAARCKDGVLFISNPGKDFQRLVMPGGSYHNYDINLFYMNIRENSLTRTRVFMARPGRRQSGFDGLNPGEKKP